jgi:Ca-activated chloride channel family protein
MTDGYIGNEMEIINEIKTHANARVFSFGIGNSVNRYLLDKMAEAGRGEVEYVSLRDDGSVAARRFHERVRSPLLTDISIDWGGLPVADVLPQRVPDVFTAKPVVVTGRFASPARGTIRLRGTYAGAPISRAIAVNLPASEPKHDALASLWARTKIDALMHEPNNQAEITQLGLDFRLMTPYTSFVAVEETVITEGGKPRRVDVPVDIPDGVSYEGVFGNESGAAVGMTMAKMAVAPATPTFMAREQVSVTSADMAMRAEVSAKPASKLHPALTGVSLTKLTVDGKVRVMVWLKTATPANLAALKQIGFELFGQPKGASIVIGRIDAAKLEQLVKLDAVTRVAPAP